jgi:hypothetical protein
MIVFVGIGQFYGIYNYHCTLKGLFMAGSEFFPETVLPTASLCREHRGYTGYEQTYLALRKKLNTSQNNLTLARGLKPDRGTKK